MLAGWRESRTGLATPRAVVLLCTVDLRLQGRRGREVLAQPLGSQSQDPGGSREILGVCGWELGGHLQGGPWKESSQSVKEKNRPKFIDFRRKAHGSVLGSIE